MEIETTMVQMGRIKVIVSNRFKHRVFVGGNPGERDNGEEAPSGTSCSRDEGSQPSKSHGQCRRITASS